MIVRFAELLHMALEPSWAPEFSLVYRYLVFFIIFTDINVEFVMNSTSRDQQKIILNVSQLQSYKELNAAYEKKH